MPPESDGLTVRDRRPIHPGQPAQHEHPDGHHRPGIPRADHRVSLTRLQTIEGDPHGRILLLQRTGGGGVHVDGGRSGHDAHGRRVEFVTRKLGLHGVRLAYQGDLHPVFVHGLEGARDDNARAVVTAHRVNDNAPHHGQARGRPRSLRRGSRTGSCSSRNRHRLCASGSLHHSASTLSTAEPQWRHGIGACFSCCSMFVSWVRACLVSVLRVHCRRFATLRCYRSNRRLRNTAIRGSPGDVHSQPVRFSSAPQPGHRPRQPSLHSGRRGKASNVCSRI